MKDLVLFTVAALFSITAPATEGSDGPSTPILQGSVDGYDTRNFDDKLDFGLVIPTLTKEQVLNFSLSSVLSTKTDTVRASGQSIKVPSNVSLPKQKERYFITIKINKPTFRLPIHLNELPETVAILAGSMPFRDTVRTLRGGDPLFSVLNTFTFKSFSLTPLTNLEDDLQLTAGDQPIEGETTTFNVPFEIDEDYLALGLNLNSTMNEAGISKYFPVNIKTLEQPQNLLSMGENNTPMIVIVPKGAFDTSAEETANLLFPFSLVWEESQPATMLPLGKDFVSFERTENTHGILIDNSKLSDFTVLAYRLTVFDTDGAVLIEETFETLENITWSTDMPASRIRLDVLATDPDPIMTSINSTHILNKDIFKQAKYITRYEEDIN